MNFQMDEKLLRKLLKHKAEADWLDFKRQWNLFDANGKVVSVERDELIKDVLGLANGNSSNVRKTKYLIIGADDKQFDQTGMRVLYDVDYQVPTQSQIAQWVNDASTPPVVGMELDSVEIEGKTLYVLTIPPTFELHETKRELKAKGHFNQYAVFMRQDEHTVLASVRDGVTIQQLKLLYRQETLNPSAWRFGVLIGAIMALVFWNAGYSASGFSDGWQRYISYFIILVTGGLMGLGIGLAFQQWKGLAYDWRYWSLRKKIFAGILAIIYTTLFLWYFYFRQ